MKIKKILRFLVLFIFIIMASILPFPIKFHRKDNSPSFKIEQVDEKEEDENLEESESFS